MKPFPFLALCLFLALPARAAADPFAEFRIPDHIWRSGSANLGLSGDRHHQDAGGAFVRSSSLRSAADGSLRAGWDSDPLQYGFALAASGRLETDHSRSGSESRYLQRGELVGQQSVEGWRLVGDLRAYPWEVPVGLGISTAAQGNYSQSRSRTDSRLSLDAFRAESRSSRISHVYQTVASADLSVGLGRVRDVSVVYDVHLLEERLAGTGALTRSLSAEARARLAALYYVSPFFAAAHERPDRFVWREIERVLREDGALAEGGLDAYSVLRAREPAAPGGRSSRQRGWFVGPVGRVQTQHAVVRDEQEYDDRIFFLDTLMRDYPGVAGHRAVASYDQFLLGGQAEYHLPLGWRWQADADCRVTRPVRQGEKGLDASSAASLSWFVADRWSATVFASQYRSYFSPRGRDGVLTNDAWDTAVGTGVAYYLEDHTSLSLSVSESQTRVDNGSYPPRAFTRDGSVDLRISYRFLGRLDAPGLMEPVRPLR